MAEVLIMPKMGYNMDEGQLFKWRKNIEENVAKGEILFEIITDKTTMPVEATSDGMLLKILVGEGETVPVFTPIAVFGQAGEDPAAALAAAGSGRADSVETPAAPAAPAVALLAPAASTMDIKSLKLTPKAKKLIADQGIDPASLAKMKGTGFQGGLTARDIMATPQIKASPLAAKLAQVTQVDLATVSGSGVDGKVMKADVLAATPSDAGQISPDKKILSVSSYKGIRKVIGERLAQSKFTAPHLYFFDKADITAFTAFRKNLNDTGEIRAAVSDLLIMAACKALRKFPALNASLVDDQIICWQSINIGLAVAGEGGLIVPVVKNAQEKNLTEVALETRDLVARAQTGRLDPADYTGGTFTISNLGPFGIESFTAIINPPEAAILGISAIRKTPVAITGPDGEDAVAIRPLMGIQLSVDHRLIDGVLAAQFVAYYKSLLENPLHILT